MGLKEQFKAAAAPRKPLKVQVDGVSDPLYVRVMTVGERDAWEVAALRSSSGKVPDDFRSRYLAVTLCDEHGVRLFADDEWRDIATLDSGVVSNLFDVAAKYNKLAEADITELAGE
jgi:hypothetical protein